MELVTIGLVAAGLVLLFSGAALSIYAVSLLGLLIGAGGGYVLAPTVLSAVGLGDPVGLAVVVLAGGLLGGALAYVALSFATAIPAFVVGAYLGLYVITPIFTDGGLIRYGVMILGGVVGAALGFTMTKTALVFITSFIGAALASLSVTLAELTAAQSSLTPEPLLFDPLTPAFAGLFAVGILAQLGFVRLGWTTKIVTAVPVLGRVFRRGEAS